MSKLWFQPLLLAAILVSLLGLALLWSPTTAVVGWFSIALAAILAAFSARVRTRTPNPQAKGWLPWVAVSVGLLIYVFGSREANLLLLDAGIEMADPIQGRAENAVAAAMRDPTSVIFSDVQVAASTVCGRVNGKNGFGAYGGAVKFVWTETGGPEIEGTLTTTGFESVDRMKQCFFETAWANCQGSSDTVTSDCTAELDLPGEE